MEEALGEIKLQEVGSVVGGRLLGAARVGEAEAHTGSRQCGEAEGFTSSAHPYVCIYGQIIL